MFIYCLKCRYKTATEKQKAIVCKNERYAISGRCQICNSKKQQFVTRELYEVMDNEGSSNNDYDMSDDER